jgi:hypothetical protein
MCTIFNKNINVIYLDNISKKLNYSLINYETVFQVTPELLPMSINEKDMNEICSFFETPSNINALMPERFIKYNNWLQKINELNVNDETIMRFNTRYGNMIEIVRNIDGDLNNNDYNEASLCQLSIVPFYKTERFQKRLRIIPEIISSVKKLGGKKKTRKRRKGTKRFVRKLKK